MKNSWRKNFQTRTYPFILTGLMVSLAYVAQSQWPQQSHAQTPWIEAKQEVTTSDTSSSPTHTNNNYADAMKLNQTFIDLAEKLKPSVVNIYTTTTMTPQGRGLHPHGQVPDDLFDYFFGNPLGPQGRGRGFQAQPREARSLGSGFVINKDGYIITNSHVVRSAGRNADEIIVKFVGEDNGKGHLAEVVGVDELTDVALLKLKNPKDDIVATPLGDSDQAKTGEWVIAIGNPYGHTHTVTQGIVSALGRNIPGARAEFIQTSASINPGNSGGPLFNLKGEVIGINTAINPQAQNIGFAIPINTAKHIISQLIEHGEVQRGWIGVAIDEVTEEAAGYMKLPNREGVLVKEVFPGDPADRAGVKVYDVIKQIGDYPVKTTHDLFTAVDQLQIGEKTQVKIWRNGDLKTLTLKVGSPPQSTSRS